LRIWWSANIRKLAKDHKGDPQISENWPRTIRATVPQLKHLMNTLRCHQVDKTTRQDVMKKSISCKASEQVGF
jgi:hypothetical protein